MPPPGSNKAAAGVKTKSPTGRNTGTKPVSKPKTQKSKQNLEVSNGQDNSLDFLFEGDSPEAQEQKWLKSINQLLEKKTKVHEADKFTERLKQLYEALLEELCKRCGVSHEPIFQTEESKEIQLDTKEKEKEQVNDTDKILAEASAKLSEVTQKYDKLETEKMVLQNNCKVLQDNDSKNKADIEDKSKEIKNLKETLNQMDKEMKECKERANKAVNVNVNVDMADKLNLSIQDKDKQISNLTDENTKKDTQISNQNEKFDKLQKEKTKLENDIKEREKTIDKDNQRLKILEEENSNLKKQIESLRIENDSLKTSNADRDKNKVSKNNEQVQRLTTENESEKLKSKSLQEKLDQQEKSIKDLKNDIRVLEEEKESLNHVVGEIKQQVRTEVDVHNKNSDSLKQTLKAKESDLIDLKRDLEKYKKQIDDLNISNKRLKEEKSKLKEEKKTNSKGPDHRLKELQEENSNLRDRLSQVAGSKMTDSNPAIADLGDPNRPTQLGEKFSEMYDNDWTDAMEELGNAGDERTNINLLRTIIEKAYEFGKIRAATYNSDQEKALLNLSNSIQMNTTLSKLIKELRKNIGILVVDGLYQAFTSGHTEFKAGGDNVKTFMKKAVALCWLMAIQDPPVILTTKTPSGKFDTDRFRHYTKSGSTVDYVVWPVVLLHEGGPIICKGVAQGK